MAIVLDHTIVPSVDKSASAEFFAEIFGLNAKQEQGPFAPVKVNENMTMYFDAEDENGSIPIEHYAFHVIEAEFYAIFGRVKTKGLAYGSGPFSRTDGKLNGRRGGRGVYFEDPNGHVLELMTVRETGS